MEFSAENLEQAVLQFYSPDPAIQRNVHHWLTVAQSSPEAWRFVWELLQPGKPPVVQFFAASTLHMKIMKFWQEIPVDQYENLKKQFIQSILNLSTSPKIVLNKLCIALSGYILQTITSHWKDAISELISTLQPSNLPHIPPTQVIWLLLQILTVFAEEFQSSQMSANRKVNVRIQIEHHFNVVLQLLESILATDVSNTDDNSAHEVIRQAVTCSSAWFLIGIPIKDCEGVTNQLINTACQIGMSSKLKNLGLIETIMDSLSNMITHPNTHKFPSSCIQIIPKLLMLKKIVHQESFVDPDLMKSMYELFISFCEAHSTLLLDIMLGGGEDKDNAYQVMQTLIECSDSPGVYPVEETTSNLVFGIWFIIQDDALASEKFVEYSKILYPFYELLTKILLDKCKLPNDASWAKEEKELFRIYRQDAADTLMYSFNILRYGLLEILWQRLNVAIFELKENAESWRTLESCLFAFMSVSESVVNSDSTHLPFVFGTLQQIPLDNLDLRAVSTMLDTIGSYAEWLNKNPTFMMNVIPPLITGLSNAELAPSATMALKDLTRDCQMCMVPFAHLILRASQEALSQNKLKVNECVRLMFTVGRVLVTLPFDDIMNYLNQLLSPYLKELETSAAHQIDDTGAKACILCRMKMLSTLFSTLNTKEEESNIENPCSHAEHHNQVSHKQDQIQPVYLILQSLIPILQMMVHNWYTDLHVTEVLCSVLKHSVNTLLDECIPLLPDIIQLIIKSYTLNPHPPLLDVTKQIILVYGRNESMSPMMSNLLCEVCNRTLSLATKCENISDLSDILESFFSLLSQIIKKFSKLFVAKEEINITGIFQLSIITISIPEVQAVKASSVFLINFITRSREIDVLLPVVQSCGEALTHQILRNIGGDLPRTVLDPMVDLLLILNKKYCDSLGRWLQMAIQLQIVPLPRATKEQKEQFVKSVLREKANKSKLQQTVREFSLVCRGLIGLEMGRMSVYF